MPFLTLVCFCEIGMLAMISTRSSTRCGGTWVVMLTVSTTHPRTSLMVSRLQSPWRNFFKDTGSLQWGESSGWMGRKTSSMEWSKVWWTRRRNGFWAREMKSSTKMSTYCKGNPSKGRHGSRVSGTGTAMVALGLNVLGRSWLGRITSVARSSRWWHYWDGNQTWKVFGW
jgi:hypothetical protein